MLCLRGEQPRADGQMVFGIVQGGTNAALREGWIAFELAGGPTTIEFKDIRLKQIPANPRCRAPGWWSL